MIASFSDERLDDLFEPILSEKRFAVAVSGGGDSIALLLLANRWVHRHGAHILALTVDHGLRAEAAQEAALVAALCADHGIPHQILTWRQTPEENGNLSDRARAGRYSLMADACRAADITALLTGHTLDDQAETVLMRLARGSGVDGLAAMRSVSHLWGVRLFRPLLGVSRAELRDYLRSHNVSWTEDPTNEDPKYDRIKARTALKHLIPLGITPDRLAATAGMMSLAADALEAQADDLAGDASQFSPLGYVEIAPHKLANAHRETALRLLSRILCAVSGQTYRPRLAALSDLLDDICAPDASFAGRTLHGCQLSAANESILIQREPSACTAVSTTLHGQGIWDNRFKWAIRDLSREDGADKITIRCTGAAGLRALKAGKLAVTDMWQSAPRAARLTAPALWRDEELLGIPLAGVHFDALSERCEVSTLVTNCVK